MKLCPDCESRLFDECAEVISRYLDFWPEDLFVRPVGYGPEIEEDTFLAAMAARGWYCCRDCELWTISVDAAGLCKKCAEGGGR